MLKKTFVVLMCCFTCLFKAINAEVYAIRHNSQFSFQEFDDAQSTFGGRLSDGVVKGQLVNADPPSGCDRSLKPPPNQENNTEKWVVLMPRHTETKNCTFVEKVRNAQNAGYDAVIVYNIHSNQLIPMSAENATGIYIPSVFVGESSGIVLKTVYANPNYYVVITAESPFNIQTHLLIPFAIVVGICFIVMLIFMIVKFIKDRRRQRRHRLPTSTLNKIPTCKYQKGDPYDTCAICLDDYIEGEKLRVLPCNHVYHTKCIDPWLTKNRRVCPICKRKVFAHDEPRHRHDDDTDTDSDGGGGGGIGGSVDDTTPLIHANARTTDGGTFRPSTASVGPAVARSVSQQSGAIGHLVTASDHHSINADDSGSSSSADGASSDTSLSTSYDDNERAVRA